MSILMSLIILIPLFGGLLLVFTPADKLQLRELSRITTGICGVTFLLTVVLLVQFFGGGTAEFSILHLTQKLELFLRLDSLGAYFLCFISFLWLMTAIYSGEYLKHEKRQKRFFSFYLFALAALQAISCAGNLATMYACFEMVTLLSMALVFHSQTKEAIMAGMKYLFYSLAGAYASLFGIIYLYNKLEDLTFTPGGVLDAELFAGNQTMMLIAAMAMIVGFGAKAGMFPMHAWLPAAHPVAPAPASAMLSGLVIKSGILCIIRTVYYIFGAALLRGTWVQYTWMALAAYTVFLGSMLAYNEGVFKKRLAYSSVSQSSYINLGLAALTPAAMTGALLHICAHAVIKTCLFLCAGAVIYKTGKTRVDQLHGIGKSMPKMLGCFTLASLALVGIPPTAGFVSKWYLATGILQSETGFLTWFGPAILLVSALLTAGYLLTITIRGFFPGAPAAHGHEHGAEAKVEAAPSMDPNWRMILPLTVLGVAAVLLGLFANPVLELLSGIAGSVM